MAHAHSFSYSVQQDSRKRTVLNPGTVGTFMNVNLWILLVIGLGALAARLAPLFEVDLLSLVSPRAEWLAYVLVAYVLGFRVFPALDRPSGHRLLFDHVERVVRRRAPYLFLPYASLDSVVLQVKALPAYGGFVHRLSLRDKDGRSHPLDTSSSDRSIWLAVLLAKRLGLRVRARPGLLPPAEAALRALRAES